MFGSYSNFHTAYNKSFVPITSNQGTISLIQDPDRLSLCNIYDPRISTNCLGWKAPLIEYLSKRYAWEMYEGKIVTELKCETLKDTLLNCNEGSSTVTDTIETYTFKVK